MGSEDGLVRYIRPSHQLDLDRGEIIFKEEVVSHLSFSSSGRYLSIASGGNLFIYSVRSKRLSRAPKKHEGSIIKTSFCEDSHLFSIGSEGQLLLFRLKGDNPKEVNDLES